MKILNFGSLNIDYTYQVEHIVRPGETISSQGLEVYPGGKGLNQSVAMARAGAKEVYHAGAVGEDGRWLVDLCRENGIHTEYILELPARTGNAVIQVAESGENCILLFAGANRRNTPAYIRKVLSDFGPGDFLVLQNEINGLDVLMEEASRRGLFIILNPSPFNGAVTACPLEKTGLFLLNEIEGKELTGKTEPEEILAEIERKYPDSQAVLTLGSRGAVYAGKGERFRQEAFPVRAVDTTGAGDTFAGYFITALAEGQPVPSALAFAARGAAEAVTRKGAVPSIPYREALTGKNVGNASAE